MEKIMHFLKLVSLVASLVALTSCGSGGGSGSGNTGDASTSTSTQLSGIASKGPVVSGTVTAFSVVNGLKGIALASTTSDTSGSFTLDLKAYTGPILIEVAGGSYKDEATGNTVALASTLRSAIANIAMHDSGSTLVVPASVTPITEAAVQNAAASTGGLTATNIQTANDDIKTKLGFDPVSTQPADATTPTAAAATTAAKAYSFLLGTVSQYLKDNPSKSLSNAASDFAITLRAGGSGLAGNPLITASGNNFGANANNQTGVATFAVFQTQTDKLATIDDEDPVSQRAVAAALFKQDLSGCSSDSVQDSTCSVWYNYNLSGMPGCFPKDESNYIDHYQKIDGIDWKFPGFMASKCSGSHFDSKLNKNVADNIYSAFKWSMNDGRVMDGTHNGIDFVYTKNNHQDFYSISSGEMLKVDNFGAHTIAVYDKANDLTVFYLHSDPSPRKGGKNGDPIRVGEQVSVGDYLGTQGNNGNVPYHVHISVRAGKNFCACSNDPVNSKGGYLPPVATLLTYVDPPSAATPSVSSVSPSSMTANGSSQDLMISGSNFFPPSVVQYKWGQGSGANVWTNSVSTPTVNSSNQIMASMNPGAVADTIKVRVCSNNGLSNCSDGTKYVSVTVAAAPGLTISAPTGISATAGNGQATISWDAVSGATSYNLYMASVTGVTKSNYSSLAGGAKTSGVTSPYIQAGLTNGTPYYFVVTAVNANDESSESSQVSTTPQASSTPQAASTPITYQPGNDIGVQDIWTTSVYSYLVGGGPGGGLNNELLRVGGWGDLYYSLIQFDLSQLPLVGSKVELQLYMPQVTGGGTTGLYVDRITAFWDWRTQGTGTDRLRLWWADRPTAVQWIQNAHSAPTAAQWYVIDITTLYNAWQAGIYPNYGLQLRPVTNNNTWAEFSSSNSVDTLHRPRLVVTP